MAGRIRDEDIQEVREKARIDEVVSDYVTLRNAGGGSQKGLCPFHDEKSPSFHVTPARQFFHCFGCGEGGDVFTFLMKIDGLGFSEAVERLADKVGVQLRREDGPGQPQVSRGPQRGRLIEVNKHAQAYYADMLSTPDALVARQFLGERGFDKDAAETFGSGFAPRDGESLLKHLRQKGFSEEELVASGVVGAERPRALRPLPRPAAVADPRRQRRRDRVRRPPDLRRRPHRGEVPQHPRDHDLQEVPGPLRHRPGPARDRPRLARRSWSRATPT